MPISFADFTLADWKRLRPVTQTLKTWRYQAIDRLYRRRPARAGDMAAVMRAIRGQDVLATIAFNDAEAIRWQAALIRHYLPRPVHLVIDNSSADRVAADIAALAATRGLPYLRLPKNPWRAFSRSHGIALNWVWHNVLRPGAPRAFGFLDDDLFPTAPDDPFEPLESQDFFGVVRAVPPRWFLWAGYCTFRYDAVKNKPLDFGQDWFVGLDTGGGNWKVLYCHHADYAALRRLPTSFEPYKTGVTIAEAPMQWCGPWLHEIGTAGDLALAADKRRVVGDILAPHLAAAGEPR